jgi:omega-6 fatty acid desaturase (delta-12 desaturase)
MRAENAVQPTRDEWRAAVAKYQRPSLWRSLWQIINTFIPYVALLYVMYLSLAYSYWLTLGLAVVAGGLLLRIFIIFHDCCHSSFFVSRKANDIVGMIAGFLVFTPYHRWRHEHAVHHATSGDLDHRGVGDIYTMTVNEYRNASRFERLKYRLFRHPIVLLGLGPLYTFLISHRFCRRDSGRKERLNVYATNVALLALLVAMTLTIGLQQYVMIHLPVILVAATVGIWFFYVQHQFEDAYWEHNETWDFATAALQGSSYFKLPKVLQWFSGNIGLHHIHHLSARIPNYYLQKCHDETPLFQNAHIITLGSSLKTLSLHLWDEEQRKMVGFRHLNAPSLRRAVAEQRGR